MTVSTKGTLSSILGVDVSAQFTDGTSVVYSKPQFNLGDKMEFTNGDTYRFVRAAAAKTKGLLYIVDETWTVSTGVVTAANTVSAMGIPAFTTTAPTTLDSAASYTYFWIQTAGNFATITATAAVTAGNLMYTTSTAGQVSATATSCQVIQALKVVATIGSAGTTTGFSQVELHIASA